MQNKNTYDVALSVIIPLFNEEGILWDNLQQLATGLDSIVGANRWQFIMVDNGSIDQTPEIIDRACQAWPSSLRVNLPKPNYGAALRAGLAAAQAEYAHIINIDFWDMPAIAWSWKNRADYDMIIASKRSDPTINRQDRYRRTLSWGLNSLLNGLFDYNGTDTHGPKFIHLPTLRPVMDGCIMNRGQFDTEFTIKAFRMGLRLAEIPVPYSEKRKARNLMFKKVLWNIQDLFKLRQIIHETPWSGEVNYRRFTRADVEKAAQDILSPSSESSIVPLKAKQDI